LTDLTFIEDGNKDTISKNNLINVQKWKMYADILMEIQQYQQTAYNFTPVGIIQNFILYNEMAKYDQEKEYQLSLICEPRKKDVSQLTMDPTQLRNTTKNPSNTNNDISRTSTEIPSEPSSVRSNVTTTTFTTTTKSETSSTNSVASKSEPRSPNVSKGIVNSNGVIRRSFSDWVYM